MRKSIREIARLFALEKVQNPAAVPVLVVQALGTDKSLRFSGYVGIGAGVYEVATDSGKLRTFSTADDFVKTVAKAVESGEGEYTVKFKTWGLLASSVPNDLQAWAEQKIISLGKVKLSQQAVIVGLDNQIALLVGWENGNAAQRAKKAELQEQRVCVAADVAAIDAEVGRLNKIVAGGA